MSVPRFFDLEAQKIAADGQLVSLFTSHPGTLGAFREARLRTYLRDHIGKRHEIASGFITDHDPGSTAIVDRSSRQIDCLIYDPSERAPLIAADAFVAVLPPHVGGFVEVKSHLGINRSYNGETVSEAFTHLGKKGAYRWSGTLVDALENVLTGIDLMRQAGLPREDYFVGIFAYEGSDLNLFEDALSSGELISQLGIKDIDDLPDCICIVTRGWWSFSAYQWNDVDPDWDNDYDPATSYLLSISGADVDGAALQLFTSYLAHVFDRRAKLDHRTGGLRSFAGRQVAVKNTALALPCPGKGG